MTVVAITTVDGRWVFRCRQHLAVQSLAAEGSLAAAGGKAHELAAEVDVSVGPLRAGGVPGELVVVPGPVAVGDAGRYAAADHGGQFGGGAVDPAAELGCSPVFRGRVQRGRHRDGAQEREQ